MGRKNSDVIEPLSYAEIGAAIEVHRHLGPGLLEKTYEECLCRELSLLNIPFNRQVDIPVEYKGVKLECGLRLDLVVYGELILELKSVESILNIHKAQLLTYLKLTKIKSGLILNFNVLVMKDGIERMVH